MVVVSKHEVPALQHGYPKEASVLPAATGSCAKFVFFVGGGSCAKTIGVHSKQSFEAFRRANSSYSSSSRPLKQVTAIATTVNTTQFGIKHASATSRDIQPFRDKRQV